MRAAYALLGILFIAIALGAIYAANQRFTTSSTSSASMQETQNTMAGALMLTSSAFENNGSIPSEYTCDGSQKNPPLSVAGVPEAARSLVLIMDDPDVPRQLRPDGVFDHWVLFNIPPRTREIAAGMIIGTAGRNSAGKNAYTGPCPPREYEPSEHRYIFKLYALDTQLPLQEGASKSDVESAMREHIIEQAQLIGRYKRM